MKRKVRSRYESCEGDRGRKNKKEVDDGLWYETGEAEREIEGEKQEERERDSGPQIG